MGFDVISNEAHHRVALVGGNVVALFRAGPTTTDVVRGWDAALAKRPRRASRAIFFGIVEQESLPPDGLARAAISRFFEAHHEQLAGCVVVVEGSGFRAATGRAVVTTVMSILPRRRFPFARHTTSDLDEAVEWARALDPQLDPRATLTDIQAMRTAR